MSVSISGLSHYPSPSLTLTHPFMPADQPCACGLSLSPARGRVLVPWRALGAAPGPEPPLFEEYRVCLRPPFVLSDGRGPAGSSCPCVAEEVGPLPIDRVGASAGSAASRPYIYLRMHISAQQHPDDLDRPERWNACMPCPLRGCGTIHEQLAALARGRRQWATSL